MDQNKVQYGVKGFRVQFSNSLITLPQCGATLKFDKVLCNEGNGYDPATGIFTAFVTGVFSFYISGVAQTDQENGFVDLVIERFRSDGHPLGHLARVFLKPYGDFLMGSQGCSSVKLKLEKGDKVLVRHLQGDLKIKGGTHTIFQGVLEFIYPDSA